MRHNPWLACAAGMGALFAFATLGLGVASATGSPVATTVDEIVARAKCSVGNSYFWGHGRLRCGGDSTSSCSGACPSCTHAGSFGADCSGMVAKAWNVPTASDVATDSHPFSTSDFMVANTPYWHARLPRPY